MMSPAPSDSGRFCRARRSRRAVAAACCSADSTPMDIISDGSPEALELRMPRGLGESCAHGKFCSLTTQCLPSVSELTAGTALNAPDLRDAAHVVHGLRITYMRDAPRTAHVQVLSDQCAGITSVLISEA